MIFDTECELLNHISARSFSLKKFNVFDILNYICQTRDIAMLEGFSALVRFLINSSAVA